MWRLDIHSWTEKTNNKDNKQGNVDASASTKFVGEKATSKYAEEVTDTQGNDWCLCVQ